SGGRTSAPLAPHHDARCAAAHGSIHQRRRAELWVPGWRAAELDDLSDDGPDTVSARSEAIGDRSAGADPAIGHPDVGERTSVALPETGIRHPPARDDRPRVVPELSR